MWPSIFKWTYTCQKNLKIQFRKYLAFDLAFVTFVGLSKILLRSLRCKKSGGMQESCTLAFYHQKQFSLKFSHFESVCTAFWTQAFQYKKGPCSNSSSQSCSGLVTYIYDFSFWATFACFDCRLFIETWVKLETEVKKDWSHNWLLIKDPQLPNDDF